MGALSTVEGVGFGRGLSLFDSGEVIRIGDLGAGAQAAGEKAVEDGEDGEEAAGEDEDIARYERISIRGIQMRVSLHERSGLGEGDLGGTSIYEYGDSRGLEMV